MAETALKWVRERPGSWRKWSAAGITFIAYMGLFTSVHLALGLFLAFMGEERRTAWFEKPDLQLPLGSIAVMGLMAILFLGTSVSIHRAWRSRFVVLDSLMLWIGLLNSLLISVLMSLRLDPVLVLVSSLSALIIAIGLAYLAVQQVVGASFDV